MRRRATGRSIDADLATLASLSRDELAERWHKRFGHKPPKGCGRTLLELAEAYAIQAAVFGSLKPSLRKRLEGKESGISKCLSVQQSKQRAWVTPGTRLVREWNGKTYHVEVVENGFIWNGNQQIRDKIAASKRKGMWMGGAVPLGYESKDKKLVVNPAEAETVRMIFRLYRAIGSVRKLKERLDELGSVTKPRQRKDGEHSCGKPFTRGHLYWLLSNPIYAGLIRHKDRVGKGQHEAIIDHDTWETTQASLSGKAPFQRNALARPTTAKGRGEGAGVLAGLLYDETGDLLSPSHANKYGIRYRYYVSQRLMQAGGKDSSAWRLPARVLEDLVIAKLVDLFGDSGKLQMIIEAERLGITELETLIIRSKSLRDTLRSASTHQIKDFIRGAVVRITIEPEGSPWRLTERNWRQRSLSNHLALVRQLSPI